MTLSQIAAHLGLDEIEGGVRPVPLKDEDLVRAGNPPGPAPRAAPRATPNRAQRRAETKHPRPKRDLIDRSI